MSQTCSTMLPEGAKLVLATRNSHKVAELREILAPLINGLTPEMIISAADFDLPEPVEDDVTFTGNALIKARQIAQELGIPAVADDSGLRVDVLGGAPGIFSARWAGVHGDDRANLDLLLAQLADIKPPHRGAQFVCAAAVVHPDGREWTAEGELEGVLRYERSGANGFGYDPIFQPQGFEVTNAELSPAEKNSISHRGKAFKAIAPVIAEVLGLELN